MSIAMRRLREHLDKQEKARNDRNNAIQSIASQMSIDRHVRAIETLVTQFSPEEIAQMEVSERFRHYNEMNENHKDMLMAQLYAARRHAARYGGW